MKMFKRVLDIFIGVTALVLIAGLILYAFNWEFNFMDDTLLKNIMIHYPIPILIGIICMRFTCDKLVWFILTIVFVALALWIYFFTPGFFSFIHSIFGWFIIKFKAKTLNRITMAVFKTVSFDLLFLKYWYYCINL